MGLLGTTIKLGLGKALGAAAGSTLSSLAGTGIGLVGNWLQNKITGGTANESSAGGSASNWATDSSNWSQSQMSQYGQAAGQSYETGSPSALGGLYSTAISTPTYNTGLLSGLYNLGSSLYSNANSAKQAQLQYQRQVQLMQMQQAYNSAEAQKTRDYNSQEAQKNRDWQVEMSNTSYQRGVKDLQAAGLNPVLAAYNGYGAATGSGATASTSSASSGLGSASMGNTYNATMQAMYSYGHNTSAIINELAQAVNSAKKVGAYQTSNQLRQSVEQIGGSSARGVSAMAEYLDKASNYNTKESYEWRDFAGKSSKGGKTMGGGGGRTK